MRIYLPPIFVFTVAIICFCCASQTIAFAQDGAGSGDKQMKKDDVFPSIARRLNALIDTPNTTIANELDAVIEITGLSMLPDGKAQATIQERSLSEERSGEAIRLVFAPPAAPDKDENWNWEQFENRRKLYPVEKLFSYTKEELGSRKQATILGWNALIAAILKQCDAGVKALEAAKILLKADPDPLPAMRATRIAFTEALKENRTDDLIIAYHEFNQHADALGKLSDTYTDLKKNDPYLRAMTVFNKAVEETIAARKNYMQAVEVYNQTILKLPFSLAAYGLNFHKIEVNVSEDQ